MAKRKQVAPRGRTSRHEVDAGTEALLTPMSRAPARQPLEARSETQKRYISAIKSHDVIFGIGPAGGGKTYVPTALAAEALMDKRIERIVITRPAVECDEQFGFIPGEIEDKYEPYLQPFRQTFIERMGKGPFEYALKAGRIAPMPLAFMRGITFNDCWVLLDEAQNLTHKQFKMFLTRIGENCKVIISGDPDQDDIGGGGLPDAVRRTSSIRGFKVVEFTVKDVVRSGICMEVLKAYETPRG
jgi:phosphate starvation-inducible PhoH-like protein